MKRMLIAVPLLMVLGTALAGCAGAEDDGPDVATVAGTKPAPSASASVAADDEERRKQFTDCMRANGVDMDDMKVEGGGVAIRADKKETSEAMEKCRQFLPDGGEPPKMSQEDLEKLRQYAQCMRENGVPEFPDPDPDTGGVGVMVGGKNGSKKEIEAANEKCKDKMPQMGKVKEAQ
ncbi:hypothetical protein [Phytohabitans rumicis]|uniref:Lipoprotein n=1 Tax=Phytohabitans rumicis TaxID=1076125 RepID=A0A6V8LDN7_9ACTN|nr:hypothetical protein [Phytohabitans rumicis]GFJ90775.1 hypothetical protein Prum_044170 [Phytohabitans rumicis]